MNIAKALSIATATAVVMVIGSACNHDGPGVTTTTGASVVSTDDAVSHLAARRCQREVDCDGVGQGKTYDDLGTCERALDRELRSDLRPSQCTYGVRQEKLDECLQEIRDQRCESPLAALSALKTCQTRSLCIQ